MKKFLVIAFLFAFIGGTMAQWTTGVKLAPAATDTMKVGALTVTKYIPVTAGYGTISIQPIVTKTSGTVAAVVKIYGTVDGTNYVQIGAVGDTLACGNVALTTKVIVLENAPYTKIKIVGVGTGTMNALLTVWYVLRKTITG